MFRLYYFFSPNVPSLIFTNEELGPCLNFIASKKYTPQFCTIISPNNRRITFNSNNNLVFSGLN